MKGGRHGRVQPDALDDERQHRAHHGAQADDAQDAGGDHDGQREGRRLATGDIAAQEAHGAQHQPEHEPDGQLARHHRIESRDIISPDGQRADDERGGCDLMLPPDEMMSGMKSASSTARCSASRSISMTVAVGSCPRYRTTSETPCFQTKVEQTRGEIRVLERHQQYVKLNEAD